MTLIYAKSYLCFDFLYFDFISTFGFRCFVFLLKVYPETYLFRDFQCSSNCT